MIRRATLALTLGIATAGLTVAQNTDLPFTTSFQAARTENADPDYRSGVHALDARDWEKAAQSFAASSAKKGPSADAALYWEAYAQNRAGRLQEALETIAELKRNFGSSRWINDAQALALEVQTKTGNRVNPGAESDEELKLMALNSLMQSDPDKALPILQRLLSSNNSMKIKDRALFVLTQNSSPQARKVLEDTARGTSNPELQLKAIRYMGMMGGDESRKQLVAVYNSSSNEDVKKAILQSFMTSGSRDQLLNVAKTEKNDELRRVAIRQLALAGGQNELWQLYQADPSKENKKEILKSMFLSGQSARLIEVARTEKDPELRTAAIKSLGLMGPGSGNGETLVDIYKRDQDRDVRKATLNALFIQQNGKALVDLARSEKDPEMKQEIVKKMSLVHSKEVTDYMMELLR
jgi:hypothetical protein